MAKMKHTGGGWYSLSDGSRVKGKANAEAAQAELASAPPKRKNPNPDLRTTTKKSLGEMSDAHRRHIERWEPFLESIEAQHVWAATPRFPGRGAGPFFLAVKNGPRDYGIIEFDTSNEERVELSTGVTSPKTILEDFRPYRVTAKEERDTLRAAAKSNTTEAEETKEAPAKKASAKKTSTKKVVKKKKIAKAS